MLDELAEDKTEVVSGGGNAFDKGENVLGLFLEDGR